MDIAISMEFDGPDERDEIIERLEKMGLMVQKRCCGCDVAIQTQRDMERVNVMIMRSLVHH